jgi:hypothetical protein
VVDLKGYWVEIGWGDITTEGNEYASTARMWVKQQSFTSAVGQLLSVVYLEDIWERLSERKVTLGTPVYYRYVYDKTTVIYDILDYVLAVNSITLADLGDADDGIIDTLLPYLVINDYALTTNDVVYEDYRNFILRCLSMTACFLRMKSGMTAELVWPQATDTPDITYHSSESPYFRSFTYRPTETIPNTIDIFCNATYDADGSITDWDDYIMGQAVDGESFARDGSTPDFYLSPKTDNLTDANNLAEAILAKIKAKTIQGRIIRNNDCRLELYDYPAANDTRGS